MKTTVEIPNSLFLEAKSYAATHGLSLKELVEAGLRQVLESHRTAAKSFRLRKRPFKGRGLAIEAGWPAIRERIYEGRGE